MKDKIFKLFFGIFIFVFLLQFIGFKELYHLDFEMWSNQAEYVAVGDENQFEFAWAYAHPGGTVVLGTLAIQKTFDISYEKALLYFMSISVSLFITLSVLICYLIFPNSFWYLATITPLALNRVLEASTPPSILASSVLVFLFLFTFYLFQNKEKIQSSLFLLWPLFFGFLIATRVDIGIISFAFLIFILKDFLNLPRLLSVCFLVFVSFVLFDPFMWFMPIQHIADLMYKMLYHYSDFGQTSFPLIKILNVSFGFLFCLPFLFLQYKNKINVLPKKVILPFFLMTLFLYIIFLTSEYKAERYFLPLIFVWDILLPLFIFRSLPDFTKKLESFNNFSNKRFKDYLYLLLLLLFVFYPFVSFLIGLK